MNTCFFIGHRDTGSEVHTALADEVERHITSYNVTSFLLVITGTLTAWRQWQS